jgi:hydrogenase expression/formation protein HypE
VGNSGNPSRLAFTTDSYVVTPIFSPAVTLLQTRCARHCQRYRAIVVRGHFISAGFILEEGFPISDLKRVLESMRAAAAEAGCKS